MRNYKDYHFRLAAQNDTSHIKNLNEIWQPQNVTEANKDEGYLSLQYSINDLGTIIQNQEIVVSTINDEIIGYYLLNNYCPTPKRQEGLDVISKMKSEGIIDNSVRVGIGAQVVVDKNHQGKGISRQLLEVLCETVKPKYDLLYSSLSKLHPKGYAVHTKEGWQVLYES